MTSAGESTDGTTTGVRRFANRLAYALGGFGVLFFGVLGAWAFGWPRSFYDVVATYPPYNLHIFHDLGAFQLGIAAGLLAGLIWRDALLVGLLGGAAGAIVHWVSHVLDAELGGRPSDPYTVGAFGVLMAIAAIARIIGSRT